MRLTRSTFSSPKRNASGFPSTGRPAGANGVQQVGISLFNHHATGDAPDKTANGFQREGVGHPQLQHRRFRRCLARVHEGDSSRDNPQGAVPVDLLVWPLGFVPFQNARQFFSQPTVGRPGICGDHHPSFNVADERCRGVGRSKRRRRPDHGLRVAHACRHAKQDRNSPSLRDLKGQQREVVGFLGVGGLQHRHSGRHGVAAIVLFILARSHARIVRRDHYQGAGDTGVGGGKKRIRGHVQADVLHGDQGSGIGISNAQSHFQGDFLVGSPLGAAPKLGKLSRISVEGVPGYPVPRVTPPSRAARATASSPLSNSRSGPLI